MPFFLAITSNNDRFTVYTSEHYKLTELDLLNLIRLCFIEGRSKAIGRKILDVYLDATEHKKEEAINKLKKIGLNDYEKRTTKSKQK